MNLSRSPTLPNRRFVVRNVQHAAETELERQLKGIMRNLGHWHAACNGAIRLLRPSGMRRGQGLAG